MKLNPNCIKSTKIAIGVRGNLEISEIVPIERARPNMRSDRASIRGLGCLGIDK